MTLMNYIFTIAITMAITITIISNVGTSREHHFDQTTDISKKEADENLATHEKTVLPSKRVGRFLAEVRNPRAADHCHKDNDVCLLQGNNSTCCNNKCMDLTEDKHNCGACKKKCKFTETCCRGQCVNIAFDKRHCGSCNNKCRSGEYCVYGLCDYA